VPGKAAYHRGVRFFGAGTKTHLDRAGDVWDLFPNLELISDAIGVLERGRESVPCALVSFYNAETAVDSCSVSAFTVLPIWAGSTWHGAPSLAL